MKFSVVLMIIIGFLGGVIMGMFVVPDEIQKYAWIIILGSVVISYGVHFYFPDTRRMVIVACLFLGLSLGMYRIDMMHDRYPFDSFNQYHNQTVTIIGTVVRSPEQKTEQQLVRVNPEYINGEKREYSLDIVVHTDLYTKLHHKDRIMVTGKLSIRSDFLSDTERQVPYRLMSYSKGIAGDIRYPDAYELQSRQVTLFGWFDTIKQKFLYSLESVFAPPAAGLLAGMMIGDTSSLQDEMLDVFRMVGLIHIVVLSGYNITLIANAFVRIFAYRGYYGRLVFAMIALIGFIGIVGISQTALRAGIMALCVFLARYFLRPYAITRALLYALGVMVWLSPYALVFDLSLQLSFLATIGIVYLFPIIQERYSQIAQTPVGEILLQTVAVNIVVLPLILYQIGTVSLVLFPLNILVLGFIPLLTIGGFMVTLLGMLVPNVAFIIGIPIQYITEQVITLATWTADHDPFFTTVQPFPFWIVIIFYIMMIIFLIHQYNALKVKETSKLII